jgi:hypothetical protein
MQFRYPDKSTPAKIDSSKTATYKNSYQGIPFVKPACTQGASAESPISAT